MAYSTYADLQAQATAKMRRKATKEAFQAGLTRVAPPGMRPWADVVGHWASRLRRG